MDIWCGIWWAFDAAVFLLCASIAITHFTKVVELICNRWLFFRSRDCNILILIYLSTAIGLTPGGSTHLHINNTQNITINNKTTGITNKTTQITNLEACWPCPLFTNYTLAFALQLKKRHGKTSVRVAEEIQRIHIIKTPTHYDILVAVLSKWLCRTLVFCCIFLQLVKIVPKTQMIPQWQDTWNNFIFIFSQM
jgi:hypothetical protein